MHGSSPFVLRFNPVNLLLHIHLKHLQQYSAAKRLFIAVDVPTQEGYLQLFSG